MKRIWEIQFTKNMWISFGFHIDHTDPSITIHLPFFIIYMGNCKQPGFKNNQKLISTMTKFGFINNVNAVLRPKLYKWALKHRKKEYLKLEDEIDGNPS